MNFIDQTKLHDPESGQTGNCLAACVAMMLGVTLADVPEFEELNENVYWVEFVHFPALFGKRLTYHSGDKPPTGYSIGTVTSPRFPDKSHAVICLDGLVVHDPHPSRASLKPENIWYYETFEPEPVSDNKLSNDYDTDAILYYAISHAMAGIDVADKRHCELAVSNVKKAIRDNPEKFCATVPKDLFLAFAKYCRYASGISKSCGRAYGKCCAENCKVWVIS